MGVFTRGGWLWISFKGLDDQWRSRSSGFRVGDEASAQALLSRVEAEVARQADADAWLCPGPRWKFERDAERSATRSKPMDVRSNPRRLPSGRWHIRWHDGHGRRMSATFDSRDLARDALRSIGAARDEDRFAYVTGSGVAPLANRRAAVEPQLLASGNWRVRWRDASGKRASATFRTRARALAALDKIRKAQDDQRMEIVGKVAAVVDEEGIAEKLDRYVEKMRADYPALKFTRKSAARSLILKGLRAEQQNERERP